MPRIPDFYSIYEAAKPVRERVCHNHRACIVGSAIPLNDRRGGTNEYRLCPECLRELQAEEPSLD